MIQTNKNEFDIRFIDASRLSTFARCEARFLFKCLIGLRDPEESRINLDYGTVMHKVLPLMYEGHSDLAIKRFDELWKGYPYGEEDEKRNSSLSHSRIIEFVQNHSPENCPYEIVHFPFSEPTRLISENEIPFVIDIGAIYPFKGRIDAAIRMNSTKEIWGYDFKTSSEISMRYFDGFWFSAQSVGYTIALSQITQKEIHGLAYEAMRISKSRFENQLGFCYVSDLEMQKFIEEAKDTCKRMKQCAEVGEWRQNNCLCSSYASFGFPCRSCEYKLLCRAPDWRPLRRFYKKEKPFDPLDEE